MQARPMLFSAPMVRAILDGRKTQTRRIVKPQPPKGTEKVISQTEKIGQSFLCMSQPENGFRSVIPANHSKKHPAMIPPHGQVGDLIWVRETCKAIGPKHEPEIMYSDHDDYDIATKELGWRVLPSIYMPRRESRITLKIAGVRVERLQDVSGADAKAEGVNSQLICSNRLGPAGSYRMNFTLLWESINGPTSWNENPWVWVYEFEPIVQNVDAVISEAKEKDGERK